jgi:hypothetical protein
MYFRHPVIGAVIGLIEDQGLATKRAIRLYAEISHFLDQVLVATIQAHEADAPRSRPGLRADLLDEALVTGAPSA